MDLTDLIKEGIHSVAIVGASPKKGKIGNVILTNLMRYGFKGRVYLVNPKYKEVLGIKCWSSVSELPEAPDMAVIAVPPKAVIKVISELSRVGCKLAVIITSGFKEAGKENLENELISRAGPYLRIVGPNSAGIFLSKLRLYASIEVIVSSGKVGIATQSGAVGGAISYILSKLSSGPSFMISLGNMCDVDINEVLRYALQDDDTEAVIAYIEWLRSGKEFMINAKELSKRKPLVVIKGGWGEVSSEAILSHTGGFSGSYEVFLGAMKQCGAYVASDLQEACEVTEVLRRIKSIRGNRVLVVTNSGGLGILAVSHLEHEGASLHKPPKELLKELVSVVGKEPTGRNPLDFGGDSRLIDLLKVAGIDELKRTYDLLLFLYVPTALDTKESICRDFRSVSEVSIPTVVYYEGGWKEEVIKCISSKLPVVTSINNMTKAFKALQSRAKFLRRYSLNTE